MPTGDAFAAGFVFGFLFAFVIVAYYATQPRR
jgi:tetrahydromethanopterin S-methyltransferase subunit F